MIIQILLTIALELRIKHVLRWNPGYTNFLFVFLILVDSLRKCVGVLSEQWGGRRASSLIEIISLDRWLIIRVILGLFISFISGADSAFLLGIILQLSTMGGFTTFLAHFIVYCF